MERLSESDGEGGGDDDDGEDRQGGEKAGGVMSHHYVGRGIRSSWRGDARKERGRPSIAKESLMEDAARERSNPRSETTQTTSNGKGKLVDVELASSRTSSLDSIDPQEAVDENEQPPPPLQTFRNQANAGIAREHRWIPEETDEETAALNPRPPSPDRESVPDMITSELVDAPKHDWFWANLFYICLASLFATSVLVYLHTEKPSRSKPIGDSIYAVLSKSFHLLAVDTVIALIVSAVWLALLRSYIRQLTILTLVAVPVILFSFSIYSIVSSYKGYWHGERFQDKAMRVLAFAPMAGTAMWGYLAYKARFNLGKAIQILQFACKILAESPALQLAGFITQAAIIVWYWVWLSMFTRVFLEGHFTKSLWTLDGSTWWLAAYHVLMLLWVLSVVSGLQRAVAAATTSQWYFHRGQNPGPSSQEVVVASFRHAATQLFGTICLQTFLSVAVRLPILILPRQIVTIITMCFYSIIPSPIAALTNPLTLTYAAIHSQPLSVAARQLSNLPFISRTEATTTLSPRSASAPPSDALTHWRTAKLILHANRYVLTIAMGFGGWVSTARLLQMDSTGYKGSLYAYVIGLSAAAVGWSVFGAVENVVVGVVDAAVVCWASEMASGNGGVARYCREAGQLFGDEKDRGWDRGVDDEV